MIVQLLTNASKDVDAWIKNLNHYILHVLRYGICFAVSWVY